MGPSSVFRTIAPKLKIFNANLLAYFRQNGLSLAEVLHHILENTITTDGLAGRSYTCLLGWLEIPVAEVCLVRVVPLELSLFKTYTAHLWFILRLF